MSKKPDEPQKLDLRSMDVADARRIELLKLFPEIATEGGKLNFDQLRMTLGEAVDAGKERYGMNWPGKSECFKAIQTPSLGTLLPAEDESIRYGQTENMVIEGDNLEALKLLQKSYLGKIKMIYIDPPYNTGNDFIYPDNYSENLQTYLEYTGQVDSEGKKFGTNTETDGRFHSKWLSMMLPRIYLARNLLRDDGYFLASIDDSEQVNLRRLLDEVFGEENFLATLVYDKNRKNDAKFFSVGHEYIHVYAKSKALLSEQKVKLRASKEGVEEVREEFEKQAKLCGGNWEKVAVAMKAYFAQFDENDPRAALARYGKVDEKGPYRTDGDASWPGGGGPRYEVPHPTTKKPCKIPSSGWRWSTYERMAEEIEKGNVVFGPDETTVPSVRRNLFEKDDQVMRSVIFSYAQKAAQDLAKLFDGKKVFDNPKNYLDMKALVDYLTNPGDYVLDFFAGSGSTAHAVLDLAKTGAPSRKFILIQLPEPLDPDNKDHASAIEFLDSIGKPRNVAEITKERVRRTIKQLEQKTEGLLALENESDLARGFSVFKLGESNFKTWNASGSSNPAELEGQLTLHVNNVREGRTDQDALIELLLKSGFEPTTQTKPLKMAGKVVYSVADGNLLVCLEREISLELIKKMAELNPQRVVCLDAGFASNDQLKANAVQIFKTKGVNSFRTV